MGQRVTLGLVDWVGDTLGTLAAVPVAVEVPAVWAWAVLEPNFCGRSHPAVEYIGYTW